MFHFGAIVGVNVAGMCYCFIMDTMKTIIFGDSIAYGKWDSQGGWAARLRQYIDKKYNLSPKTNYQLHNLSIPGELVLHLEERLPVEFSSRVLADEENYLVIFALGINDANPVNWLSSQATPPEKFKALLKNYYQLVKKPNVQVAFIGLTPIDEDRWLDDSKFAGNFFLKDVRQYDQYLKEICQELNIPFLPLLDNLLKASYQETLVDGIHPDDKGHQMMFERIIKFLEENKLLK